MILVAAGKSELMLIVSHIATLPCEQCVNLLFSIIV